MWTLGATALFLLLGFGAPLAYCLWRLDRAPAGCVEDVVAEGRPAGPLLLCLGDSITHGHIGADWVGALRERRPALTVVNGGVNGEMAWNVRQRLDDALSLAPDAVILLIGSNDVMAADLPARASAYERSNRLPRTPDLRWSMEQLTLLLSELRGRCARVAVCTIPPLGEDPGTPVRELVATFNQHIQSSAQAAGIPVLDLHGALTALSPARGQAYDGSMATTVWAIGRAMAAHVLLGRSWDTVAEASGWAVTVDGIHLSDRGGAILRERAERWLDSIKIT